MSSPSSCPIREVGWCSCHNPWLRLSTPWRSACVESTQRGWQKWSLTQANKGSSHRKKGVCRHSYASFIFIQAACWKALPPCKAGSSPQWLHDMSILSEKWPQKYTRAFHHSWACVHSVGLTVMTNHNTQYFFGSNLSRTQWAWLGSALQSLIRLLIKTQYPGAAQQPDSSGISWSPRVPQLMTVTGWTPTALLTLAPVWNLSLLAKVTSQYSILQGVRLCTRWLQTLDPSCLGKQAALLFLSLEIHTELFLPKIIGQRACQFVQIQDRRSRRGWDYCLQSKKWGRACALTLSHTKQPVSPGALHPQNTTQVWHHVTWPLTSHLLDHPDSRNTRVVWLSLGKCEQTSTCPG